MSADSWTWFDLLAFACFAVSCLPRPPAWLAPVVTSLVISVLATKLFVPAYYPTPPRVRWGDAPQLP